MSGGTIAGGTFAIVALALCGCGKVEQKGAGEVAKPKAEAKRHQIACASPTAYDRLKNQLFDQAIDRHAGDRTNLDILADYSVVRVEDPVVEGWDATLDLTRCTGRFILQIPPGAERAFDGQRRLQADIAYTAQAAADGSGFVYRLNGAEPIIARLAAFNLSAGAYRPSPAIDPGRDDPADAVDTLPDRSVMRERMPAPSVPQPADMTGYDPEAPRPERQDSSSTVSRAVTGEAVVRSFYGALGQGDGGAASGQIIPEKRRGGSFAPDALSRFYGRLAEPIRLTGIVRVAPGAYRVRYRYAAGRSSCEGRAVVRLVNRDGRDLIRSIDALDGC